VGSQSNTNLAYIAGFLDGDGSLMLQIKKRKDGNKGLRFMATICLYQDARHAEPLCWMRDVFNIGYVSNRNDGIMELRINGFKQVQVILDLLIPYIRFKKLQASALRDACVLLSQASIKRLDAQQLKNVVEHIVIIQNENYGTRKKRTKDELYAVLGLTP
jgi:hypothetical protein